MNPTTHATPPAVLAQQLARLRWLEEKFDQLNTSTSERVMQDLGLSGKPTESLADLVNRAVTADGVVVNDLPHDAMPGGRQDRAAPPIGWLLRFNDPDPQYEFELGPQCPVGWQGKAVPLALASHDLPELDRRDPGPTAQPRAGAGEGDVQ